MRLFLILAVAAMMSFSGCIGAPAEDASDSDGTVAGDGGNAQSGGSESASDPAPQDDPNEASNETSDSSSKRTSVDWGIIIQNNQFDITEMTIVVGDSVTWHHRDGGTPHTVTSDDGYADPESGEVFDSREVAPTMTEATQSQYSFTFNQVGEFTYHCAIHPSMTGVVKVVAA